VLRISFGSYFVDFRKALQENIEFAVILLIALRKKFAKKSSLVNK